MRIVIHPAFPARGWDDRRQREEANRSFVGGRETLVLMSVLASVCVVSTPHALQLYTTPTSNRFGRRHHHILLLRRRHRRSSRNKNIICQKPRLSLLDDVGGEILHDTIKRRARMGDEHNTHDDSGVIIISSGKGNEDNSIKKCRPTVKTSLPTRTLQLRRRTSAPNLLFLITITFPYPVISIALLIGRSFSGIPRSFFDFIFRLNFIEP